MVKMKCLKLKGFGLYSGLGGSEHQRNGSKKANGLLYISLQSTQKKKKKVLGIGVKLTVNYLMDSRKISTTTVPLS